jgi:hypothetical protein
MSNQPLSKTDKYYLSVSVVKNPILAFLKEVESTETGKQI